MKSRPLCKHSVAFVFALLSMWLGAISAQGQTTSFTYQGRLTDGGTAANGNYDLQFALWDSPSGGGQVGSTLTINSVTVSNCVFTVSLDFGATAFPGASRFLEISARPSNGGSFTLLSPRQQITSTPYAVRSLNAATADSVPASGVPAGSGNYIQNSSSSQTANFNISGTGTAGGTLSGNVVNATTQYNLNGSRILSTPRTSNLFAGIGAGASDTTGSSNTFIGFDSGRNTNSPSSFGRNTFVGSISGNSNTQGIDNSFFGVGAGFSNTEGNNNAFFGNSAGNRNTTGSDNTMVGINANVGSGNLSNATAIGADAQVDQSNSLVLGSISGINGASANTRVGIGTSAPNRRLHIQGSGSDFAGAGDLLLTGTGTVGSAITLDATGSGGRRYSWISTASAADPGGGALAALDVTNTVYRMVINNAGNVGIGTTSPTATLSVNGSANKPGGGSWGVFSDLRLKHIKGRFTSGLNAVMQLQPLRYEYKSDNALNLKSEGEHVGFSAQAVQKIIPEAVSTTDNGYLLVNNDPILWTMLNAIKEQQAQIQKQSELIQRQQALAIRQQVQLRALKKLACQSHRRARACR